MGCSLLSPLCGDWMAHLKTNMHPFANYILLLSTMTINNLSYDNLNYMKSPSLIKQSLNDNRKDTIEIIISRKLPCCIFRKCCPQQSSHILLLPNLSPNYFLSASPCRFDSLPPSLRGPDRLCTHRKYPRRSIGDCTRKHPQKEGRRRARR